MPGQQEQIFLAAVPEQFTDFILPTGDSQEFKVHIDSNREKGAVCDLCGSFSSQDRQESKHTQK